MITHELKTPFIPIKGYCKILWEAGLLGNLNSKQSEAVQGIYQNCLRLEKLISDILEDQLLDMRQMKFDKKSFKVDEFLTNITKDLSLMMNEKQIEFVNSTKEVFNVVRDKNRLYQVFRNLISNSVDFVSNNGRIEMGVQSKGNDIVFYVKDTALEFQKTSKSIFSRNFTVPIQRLLENMA